MTFAEKITAKVGILTKTSKTASSEWLWIRPEGARGIQLGTNERGE